MCFPNRASRNSENPFAFGSLILPLRGAYPMTPDKPQSSPSNRPRRGGRKPGPAEQKQRHVVSVRLTDAEHARLNQEFGKEGLLPFSRFWASIKPFNAPAAAVRLFASPSPTPPPFPLSGPPCPVGHAGLLTLARHSYSSTGS